MSGRPPIPVALIALGWVYLTACPLPVSHTVATSSPVAGRLVWADGRAVPHAEVAVSTEWSDNVCQTPAHRARTDASGLFQLPGTQRRHKVFWVIPGLDVGPSRFWFCAAVSDTLRRAYMGYGSLTDSAPPDTIECIAWEWENQARVSCNGRGGKAIVTGGSWTDIASGAAGFYRLFLTEEPTRVKGYDKDAPQDRPYVYVQWVERLTADPGQRAAPLYRVGATVSLPLDRNKVYFIQELQLWQREGRWLASLHGYKHAFMNDAARAELVFELGPPGQAKQVAGP